MTAEVIPYSLIFKTPSGTSRGILKHKDTWFIKIFDGIKTGIGECGMFRELSVDDRPDYENKLKWTCENINLGLEELRNKLADFPSLVFGLETAFKSLQNTNMFEIFPSAFTEGKASIPINGLVWMGEKQFMKQQIIQKIETGFKCIKLKIGALDFEEEVQLLKYIRKEFTQKEIELRVDANGAFKGEEALEKLKILSTFDIHSIEQPIKVGQLEEMANLCEKSPLAIALDEELIGVFETNEMEELLAIILPQYIILKPTLIGGFKKGEDWIGLANKYNIGWWITSALESNIGLNAIAQFTYSLESKMYQGLGTGGLFNNNFESPLVVKNGNLHYENGNHWNFNL
ncbi:o-succinylbenzoate synthase [Flavobacteriaceae bacterium MAR_2010_188]|nr:o-succinylbenzoate synthase [Flavobacteriaceae bacterium MAR_2010_188]